MRNILFLTGILFLFNLNSYTQVPEKFNYQAVLRNSSGELIPNQSVDVEISIIDENSGGPVLYTEIHTKTTNSYGLVNLVIGSETPDFGVFADINWAVNDKFIQVQVDTGSGLTNMGTFQLLTVPFAMHAASATNLGSENVYTGTDTLFVVKDAEGNPVFVVFPDGAKVIVEEATKGTVGGFAVSGRSPTKAEETEIFHVTPDSTRIFVNDTIQSKGRVGGFAVSGRSPTKSIKSDYLLVTQDSTRIYVNDTTLSKGRVGGFAVSGRSPTKSGVQDYFNISGSQSADTIKNEPRVMWYPKKAALLAGEVHVGSADSVGTNSVALGYRNIAKGNWSQAFGFQSQALGDYSTAIGNEAEAETNSLAVGYQAKATGESSYALGSGALAIADKSFAFGSVGIDSAGLVTGNTQATGEYAYAIGLGAVASGKGAFAIGANDTASGSFATAIGYKTKSDGFYSTAMGGYAEAQGWYTVAIGYRNKAVGQGAVSLGFQNNAEGLYSFASGFRSNAVGFKSIALGADCRSEGAYSIAVGDQASTGLSGSWALSMGRECESNSIGTVAIGYQSVADGAYAIALGYQDTVKSSGSFGVAIGYRNKATGVYSLAMGTYTNASALYASAFGNTTIANGQNSFAAGYLSQASGNTATSFGTSNIASGYNSMALGYETEAQAYGSLVIGRYNIVEGTTTSWQGAEPLFVAGNGSSGSPNNALTLYQNGNLDIDGNLNANGTIYTSDKRLKTDIENLNYGLNEILKLRPVSFMWKKNSDEGFRLGLIAQEVQPVINEVVNVGNDSQKTLGIRYSELIPVLIKSIQEQQQLIEDQKSKIFQLEDRLSEIEKFLMAK